ncbi:MAG: hypothetical protein PWP23_1039 [Candidatus Sumerlaeota bacterium]|nr:hypothetical protein [Candidatus Sumerlaeota bacterium]
MTTRNDQLTAPVTALRIDGNALQAAVVRLGADGAVHVEAVRTIEADSLLERVSRASHPIFMDVDFLEFPDTPRLTHLLHTLVSDPVFQNPVVGVFPPECVTDWKHIGPDQPDRRHKRMVRGLRSFQTANPYAYPKVIGSREWPAEPGMVELSIWSARFDDLMVVAEQFLSLTSAHQPFAGLVTGKRAADEVLALLAHGAGNEPLTLIDVGKLRTLYSGHLDTRSFFSHAIPVGLARDDLHYFRSLPLVAANLGSYGNEIGSLFFPPDVTPSPLFDPEVKTPQVECTRFGIQIARYACRVLTSVWKEEAGVEQPSRILLSGMPARLRGLREYLENRCERRIEQLGEHPLPGIVPAKGISWPEIADHLQVIGAGIAYHRRDTSRFGMVLRDRRPLPLASESIEANPFDPHDIYIIEGPSTHRSGMTRSGVSHRPPFPHVNDTDFPR